MCVGNKRKKSKWDESASFEYCFVFACFRYIFFLKLNNLFTGKIKTNVFFLLPVAVKFNAFKEIT